MYNLTKSTACKTVSFFVWDKTEWKKETMDIGLNVRESDRIANELITENWKHEQQNKQLSMYINI